ncbi:site-specific integrase [Alkalicoccobacillus plakortidis]|uniref:Site-specific integrase n=1 Tax=Alkalicoccobacillus plakortidis TaxID=444060 RepID=A0ABT0XHX3_9BACI|nr:site-specific integrase [Alkalicoccobacillus plakortidis]MCM2675515.1 site-specific integrase [Alkalicoccobacillus plakortidis]
MDGYKTQRFNEYNYYRMLMYFLSQTGLRISEALALRWSDIYDGKVTVERQTSRGNNNQIVLKTLKSTSSYRTIGLNPDLVLELSQFKSLQEKLSSIYDTFKINSDEIIFQNSMGNYLTPSVVREVIKGHCKRAGVSYKGTHGFRHTHAVLLLEAGASLLYVSKRLGHKSTDITSSTYLDVTKKIEEDELEKFASYTKR